MIPDGHDLARLRPGVVTRSISPENFTGAKGGGGDGDRGHRRRPRARPRRRAGRSRPRSRSAGAHDLRARRHRRPRRDPAHLADPAPRNWRTPDPAHLLGRRRGSPRSSAGRRLLRPGLGRVRPGVARCRSRQPARRRSTATGRCRSASARASRSRTCSDRAAHRLLPDQLRDRHRRRRTTRLLPRAVPAVQPACRQGRAHDPRRRAAAQGHYVGTYLAWGVNNTGWWGEGEIKFFLDGDDEFPTICGTGTEDYFCGAYNFDVAAAHGLRTAVHDAVPRAAAGDPARRRSTSRSSASACTAGTSPTRSASPRPCASRSRRSAGARAAATCRCRTTSPRRPCSTSTARRGPPAEPRPGRPGAPLTLAAPRP